MSNYCRVCGRELKKTNGPIGPKCLQKIKGKSPRKVVKTSKSKFAKMAAKYDMYAKNKQNTEELDKEN